MAPFPPAPRRRVDKHKQRAEESILLHLPPAILNCIFTPTNVTYSNFAICRALLPCTLRALYRIPRISGQGHFKQFLAAVICRPQLCESVNQLVVAVPVPSCKLQFDTFEDDAPGELVRLAEQAQRVKGSKRYSPAQLRVSLGLVREVFLRFTRAHCFALAGRAFFSPLLLALVPHIDSLPHLSYLRLDLVDREVWSCPADDVLFQHLLLGFPCLSKLYLGTNTSPQLPVSVLNLPSCTALPPRASLLRHITLAEMAWLGPELRHFFTCLSPTLTHLTVKSVAVHPGLASDLAFLPVSLKALTLQVGDECPGYERSERAIPKLGSVLERFQDLTYLSLGGDIVSPGTFVALSALPRLEFVALQEHTHYTLHDLSRLVVALEIPVLEQDDHFSPLTGLALDICSCPPPGSNALARRRCLTAPTPRWPRGFGPAEAEVLLDAAEIDGIGVIGTVLCALRECEKDDEHECKHFRQREAGEAVARL
ncbi:hypothetical protein JCM10213_008260 [Rhodosporidiobolus nylandii]